MIQSNVNPIKSLEPTTNLQEVWKSKEHVKQHNEDAVGQMHNVDFFQDSDLVSSTNKYNKNRRTVCDRLTEA